MGLGVLCRARAAMVSAVLAASLLAASGVSGPFHLSSAVAVAKVDKVLPDRPPGSAAVRHSDVGPRPPGAGAV